jgi:hypothetical protein
VGVHLRKGITTDADGQAGDNMRLKHGRIQKYRELQHQEKTDAQTNQKEKQIINKYFFMKVVLFFMK